METRTWYKVKGVHTKIKSAKFPKGVVIVVHFGATSLEHALKMCEDKGIIDLEYCVADPGWEPGLERNS